MSKVEIVSMVLLGAWISFVAWTAVRSGKEKGMTDEKLDPYRWCGFNMPRERTVRFSEHEVYISFNDDLGAELFDAWWQEAGLTHFRNWVSHQEKADWAR